MDYSDTDSSKFSLNHYNIIPGISERNFNILLFIFIIIFFIIVLFILGIFSKNQENMSGGTLTQLFANDSQDVYLKSNVDQLATGNFDLYWNQPTRVANSYLNRGTPLPQQTTLPPPPTMASYINQNNNLKKIAEKENDITNNSAYQPLIDIDVCRQDPSSCGNGAGGLRLDSGFVNATNGKPRVSLQGSVYYPDSYVGSYFTNPEPDIMKPYPVMLDKALPIRIG